MSDTTLDARGPRFRIKGWQGTTSRYSFVSDEPVTTLAIHLGGTLKDIDDLDGTTAFDAEVDPGGLTGTVDVDVPARSEWTGSSVPARLVVDGAVLAVGALDPSTVGRDDGTNELVITHQSLTLNLTVLGVLPGGPLAALEARIAELEATATTTLTFTPPEA